METPCEIDDVEKLRPNPEDFSSPMVFSENFSYRRSFRMSFTTDNTSGANSFGWIERLTSQHRPPRHRSSSCSSVSALPLPFPSLLVTREVECMTHCSALSGTQDTATQTGNNTSNSLLGVFEECPSCRRLVASLKSHELWKVKFDSLDSVIDAAIQKEKQLEAATMALEKLSGIVAPILSRESCRRWRSQATQTTRSWLAELPSVQSLRQLALSSEQRTEDMHLQMNKLQMELKARKSENVELIAELSSVQEGVSEKEDRLEMAEYELEEVKDKLSDARAEAKKNFEELIRATDDYKKETDCLLGKISSLSTQNNNLSHELAAARALVKGLENDLSESEARRTEMYNSYSELLRKSDV